MGAKRVAVAMSGGVDSSLTAFLLKEQGYEVIGVTMQLWKEQGRGTLQESPGASTLQDARRVAEQMGIPHYVFDLEKEFETEVIQYFCRAYAAGRTPNPCIRCNQRIKFGTLLEKALELDAEHLATGHYARRVFDEETGRYLLKRGRDPKKDQSYFLFSLTQDQLQHILFPLGEHRKEDVRKKAAQIGLPVHDRPESQEVCFIQDASYHAFLSQRLREAVEPGPILDRQGNCLGRHRGIAFYTIGQRRGLRLTQGKPLYVVGIDPLRNAIVVGEEREIYSDVFVVDSVHWIALDEATHPISARVKIRYNHPGAEATLSPKGKGEWGIKFNIPQKAITPGQAAVFYDGETVLGGGWIKEVVRGRA